MGKSDLSQPLHREAEPPPARRPVIAPALISAGILLAGVAALWVALVDDPHGGRAVAVASIRDAAPAATGSVARPPPAEVAARPLPETTLAALLAAPSAGAIPGLVEQSAFGPLPRVAPDGRRPRDAYARRTTQAAAGMPRVVIVVGGMGLSQTGTQNAIATLPEDVTLAFAPYGASLQRWVDKARGEGHEVLLQIPLEPIGYPEQNPGEHTLLVSGDRLAVRNDLSWVLSRITAYAGVMNYMGERFTSDDRALTPFLGEIGARGLFYLDDGSSPVSQAARVGDALQVPVVTADTIIDRDRSAAAIQRELTALEGIARERGIAVGVASAFPGTVEAIAAWASGAEARGVLVVSASNALAR